MTTSTSKSSSSSGTSKTGLKWVNYPAYEKRSDLYGISSAVIIPPNRTMVATSGHVGRDDEGGHPEDLEEEFRVAFDCITNSLSAVNPNLSSEELWASVYQVNTFHVGGISREVFEVLGKVARSYWCGHMPAATAVEVKSLNGGVRLEIAVLAALPAAEV